MPFQASHRVRPPLQEINRVTFFLFIRLTRKQLMMKVREQPNGSAALTAGLAIVVMALTVPIVELFIFPKLIDLKRASVTASNIRAHQSLFSLAILIHFTTIVCDIISGWALYIFLRPAHKNLSLLTAMFRLGNAAFTISALSNLVQVLSLVKIGDQLSGGTDEEILFRIQAFNMQWRLMLLFFGIYLNLLGYLVVKSSYIPKTMGFFLILAGLGYVVDGVRYLVFPHTDTGYLWLTYLGELVFMFWLLLKGWRVRLSETS